MGDAKLMTTPLANHFMLSESLCPFSKKEIEEMEVVPYSPEVWSLMYTIVCTRQDITHVVSIVSRFLSNPRNDHWELFKGILRYLRGMSKLCLMFWGS